MSRRGDRMMRDVLATFVFMFGTASALAALERVGLG